MSILWIMVGLTAIAVIALAFAFYIYRQSKTIRNKNVSRSADEMFVANCHKYNFSLREIQVADLVCRGFKNQQIADELFISLKTVESHLQNIYDKVGERGKLALIAKLNQ